jgi:DNA polymerase type B, organellar and viral
MGDTVKKWHPWLDKPGMHHSLALWQEQEIQQGNRTPYVPSNAEDVIEYVGRNRLYVLCRDILDQSEFPYGDELLQHERSQAYVQKRGKIVAVQLRAGRYRGFLIPSRTWNHAVPGPELAEDMEHLFHIFGYEAITPASLSEKVFRATLGERHTIYRPSVDLRKILLEYGEGGRIDEADEGKLYPVVYTYDIKSAYLFYARSVPTPFTPPFYHSRPDFHWILDFPVGFWQVEMLANGNGIHPVYLRDRENGDRCGKRFPKHGERFIKWMWSGEIRDCIEKGYTLLHCERGYRWAELSDCMAPWSDILWNAYSSVSCETLKSIIKSMWVGLPGRFLKQPYVYNLIDQEHVRSGDVPVAANWFHFAQNWENIDPSNPPKFLTNWYVRAEYDKESTALTPIGAYIISECRREIYRLQLEEEKKGNILLGSYVDSVSFAKRAMSFLHRIGASPGDLKEEISVDGWREMNQFIRQTDGFLDVRAPGISGEKRAMLLQKYREICEKQRRNLTEI